MSDMNFDESAVRRHVAKHFGSPDPLAIRQVIVSDPEIAIMRVVRGNCNVLVTNGMSRYPMMPPPESAEYKFAELVLYLPIDWPLDFGPGTLEKMWPVEWLLRIANYPFEEGTSIGGGAFGIFSNEAPPVPFHSDTELSCFLAITSATGSARMKREDGAHTYFYNLYALYTEERDFALKNGITALLERFERFKVTALLNPRRVNVCI